MYLVELQGIEELHQWDKFRYLQINGLGSENLIQVDFYQESEEGVPEEAITMAIEEGLNGIKRVQIPNQLLERAKTIFLYLRNGEDTINIGSFPVIARPRPTNFSPLNTSSHINIANLYQKASSLYVTPEMFGAKGNGRDDDSVAIQAALNTGLPVHFYRRTYLCQQTLITKNLYNIHLKGCVEDIQNLDIDRVDPLKDKQGRVNTHPGVSKAVLMFAPEQISSKQASTYFITDDDFIPDDDFEPTSYTEGGNVILENLEFQGVVPSGLQAGFEYGGGLCSFFNRDNLTVNNCNFKNHYTNGLTLRGLKNEATIKNSIFKDLGLMMNNGSRNAISIERTFLDRKSGELLDGNKLFPLKARIENCSFDSIGDECICTTGIENVIVDNCTMNNMGRFIYKAGHRSDRFPYCHTISNCIGKYIGAGIYDANADSSYTQQYDIKPGSVHITNCHFDKLACYQEELMGNIRNALSMICDARALGYNNKKAENYPDVYIQDSYINGYVDEQGKTSGGPAIHQPFIGGGSIYLINSRISFGQLRNTSIFNFDKKMIVKNTNLYLPQKNSHVDGYFYLKEGSELKYQNSSFWVNLESDANSAPSSIIHLNGEGVLISFDNCLLSNMGSNADSFIKIKSGATINLGSISFINNSIDDKLKDSNFIHKAGTASGKIRAIKYIGNYLRTDDTETTNQVLSNLTPEDVVWTACSDNNYYGSVVEEVKK